jgi:hypothetical protein
VTLLSEAGRAKVAIELNVTRILLKLPAGLTSMVTYSVDAAVHNSESLLCCFDPVRLAPPRRPNLSRIVQNK